MIQPETLLLTSEANKNKSRKSLFHKGNFLSSVGGRGAVDDPPQEPM
jgi:hypothetical protein